MNGETGVLVSFDRDRRRALLATDDGRRIALPVDALATIRLAYCLSVHKAQGSSAKAVILVLDRGHMPMLTRELVYTGLTRSEQVAVIVSHPAALATAIRRARRACATPGSRSSSRGPRGRGGRPRRGRRGAARR